MIGIVAPRRVGALATERAISVRDANVVMHHGSGRRHSLRAFGGAAAGAGGARRGAAAGAGDARHLCRCFDGRRGRYLGTGGVGAARGKGGVAAGSGGGADEGGRENDGQNLGYLWWVGGRFKR